MNISGLLKKKLASLHTFILGQSTMVEKFSINRLFPPTSGYITYEGSMTEPGCQETVTWIVSNKPAYVTPQQLQVTKFGLSIHPFSGLTDDFIFIPGLPY